MSGFSDRKVILKIGDGAGSEAFTKIAALKDVSIQRTAAEVDTTNKDSDGFRDLLNDRTLISVAISGTGLFTDDATVASVTTDFQTGTLRNFQVDVVSTDASTAGEVLEGAFQITQFEQSAPNGGEVNYSISLASSGEITSS